MKLNKYTVLHTIYAVILIIVAALMLPLFPKSSAWIIVLLGSIFYFWGEGITDWWTWVADVSIVFGIIPQDRYHNWRIVEQAGQEFGKYGLFIYFGATRWEYLTFQLLAMVGYPLYLYLVKRPKTP